MLVSPMKIVLTLIAVMAMTICCAQESSAQRRGFRIGNVLQAGGGQGFRLGGDRLGMQFGGGQGAIIGGQNVGMRFGNGQGARFGTSNFGLQFGGGQGTQIGPLDTPSTFYNGPIQNRAYSQPFVGQPIVGQPIAGQTYFGQTPQPVVLPPSSQGYAPNVNQRVITSRYTPSAAIFTQGVTQTDIARASKGTESGESVAPPNPLGSSTIAEKVDVITPSTTALESEESQIRLSLSGDEKEPFKYKVNGSELTIKPGETVLMKAGEEWEIEFDAGGDLGGREAVLKEGGTYAFEKSDAEGWGLMKNPVPQPTAPANGDNSGSE